MIEKEPVDDNEEEEKQQQVQQYQRSPSANSNEDSNDGMPEHIAKLVGKNETIDIDDSAGDMGRLSGDEQP
ncbi:unnamed protein product [Didymodactylos carnosus]|uniref:Uncharacterized protein n=1 Tax=Didymodactylos carnosus TaxID=1234261 RepID=A0A813S3D2_9BILA|nr:unnamed protein product [Didymodactylos carnosus]CAF1198248.1 unnamed protein product [Didymodactylos carnosus]CAF3574895.1 unnamed protein product [Didymodactylos carnosus]CAF4008436.1 unnamed protein product [Didymodactylos carnosus]